MEKVFKITDEEIKQRYLNGESLNDIAKDAQDTKGVMALRNRLHKLGVDTTKNMKRYKYKISQNSKIYSFNEDTFNSIDTEEQAYWLGFLMADGYNREDRNYIVLRLQALDTEILEKFKSFLNYSGPIRTYQRYTPVSHQLVTYAEIGVYSEKMSQKLASLGCTQGKTYNIEFPNINPALYNHFIRGFFDGDGCVSITHRSGRKTGYEYQVNFVGCPKIMTTIHNIICNECNVADTTIYRYKNQFAYRIHWIGRKVVLRILDYLYKDANVYLERKYSKYLVVRQSNLQ